MSVCEEESAIEGCVEFPPAAMDAGGSIDPSSRCCEEEVFICHQSTRGNRHSPIRMSVPPVRYCEQAVEREKIQMKKEIKKRKAKERKKQKREEKRREERDAVEGDQRGCLCRVKGSRERSVVTHHHHHVYRREREREDEEM